MFRRWSRRPYSHFQFNIGPDQTYFIAIIIGEVIQLFIAKMPSKRRSVRRLRPVEDVPSKISPALIVVSSILSMVGMTMLITNNQLGDECKMEAIDKSSYYDDAKPGNLPKWFDYTGTLFVFTGVWALMACGLAPLLCRYKCRRCGGNVWANILESTCSYIILAFGVIISIIMNLIGSFWIYAAKLSRTAATSAEPGDVNYCHPVVWNMAIFITNFFWVLLILGGISGLARVHHYLRGHLNPALSNNQGDEEEGRHSE